MTSRDTLWQPGMLRHDLMVLRSIPDDFLSDETVRPGRLKVKSA